jgi:Uma2 family endonuclease
MSTPAPTAPRHHPITVREYFRMGETGVLSPDARIELIEGEIIDMPPIGPPHAGIVNRLVRILDRAIGDRAIVSAQNPMILGELSAPQPDLALLRYRDDFYSKAHPVSEDVLLAVEVADTTLAYDRRAKAPLYARFGIPELWIIDVQGRHLDLYRHPEGDRYTTQTRARDLSALEVEVLPGLVLNLSALL